MCSLSDLTLLRERIKCRRDSRYDNKFIELLDILIGWHESDTSLSVCKQSGEQSIQTLGDATQQPVGLMVDGYPIARYFQAISGIASDYEPDDEVVSVKHIRETLERATEREISSQGFLDNWQPIATAPKDRTILAVCEGENGPFVIAIWWQEDVWYTGWVSGGHRSDYEDRHATHWMELPEIPRRG